ncbi:nucleotide pyrophosphohydrolase [Patescibacteria group bacterium]|nr:nucleotide pyrophosphohydrolase [Patescibacteria group bacterium]
MSDKKETTFSDDKTTLSDVQTFLYEFNKKRGWHKGAGMNPKNLASAISVEASELQEHFQWISTDEAEELKDAKNRDKQIDYELVDVVIYCLICARSLNIDLAKTLQEKMEINKNRFKVTKRDGKKE